VEGEKWPGIDCISTSKQLDYTEIYRVGIDFTDNNFQIPRSDRARTNSQYQAVSLLPHGRGMGLDNMLWQDWSGKRFSGI